jgi:two-component system NtrC family response regulator
MIRPKLLIVEDDEAIRTQLRYALREHYTLAFAENRAKACALVEELRPELVSLDLGLPPAPDSAEEGLKALEEILRLAPRTKVVVVTGNEDRANARRAVELGAFDFYCKPLDLKDYEVVLRRGLYLHGLEVESDRQAADTEAEARFDEILGNTPRIREIFGMVTLVARTDATVLLQGESGTGKELLARAIHRKGRRRSKPFVAINCGAIPEGLLESELFGHERGAYTGAYVQRKGKVELAEGGTLFLDEIGEMALPLQVKLLRFLQEREIERIGGREAIRVDVRVLAATNRDLRAEVAAGRFREDLFFRLSVVTITVPPLRERGEDVIVLANAFLRRNCQEYRRKLRFSGSSLVALSQHPWPGNVRELENAVQRAAIMARGSIIEPADLGMTETERSKPVSLREARGQLERDLVLNALLRTRGNVSHAAKDLGVSRPALHDLIDKYRIDTKGLRGGAA